ncbi:hypothetical protein NPS46_02020 [Pseudomonas putida]|uniref:hypothetical protein n=1 Tax=Pseudomonas putida TaxID=303 RepID=UPI00236434D6|nr:hypothetical protein [Pseudomonas putida]MDD2051321.1 hypothetical protein [Pseudomonas putida]
MKILINLQVGSVRAMDLARASDSFECAGVCKCSLETIEVVDPFFAGEGFVFEGLPGDVFDQN